MGRHKFARLAFISTAGLFGLGLAGCIGAGTNSDVVSRSSSKAMFPEVVGIDLTGTERTVPADLPGSFRLVVAAFERQQQADVDTWIDRLDEIRSRLPEAEFCELPVIPKSGAMFRFYLNNGMRSGITDPQRRTQVITVYTDVPAFLSAVGRKETKNILIFLLARDGSIVGQVDGRYSEDTFKLLIQSLPPRPVPSSGNMNGV